MYGSNMEEYLALHNVSLLDFGIFVALWIIGAVLIWCLVKMWFINMRKYKDDKMANGLLTLTIIILLVVLFPVMVMGLWHFINMVLHLTMGSDLYCLLDMKLPAV